MAVFDFSRFPVLETDRLVLRALAEDDIPAISRLRSDEGVNRYIDRPARVNLHEAMVFMLFIREGMRNNRWVYWAIGLGDDPRLAGTVCLWNFTEDKTTADIGYELHPDYQKRGVMNEALVAVVRYGFDTLGLQCIQAFTHPENAASTGLLQRNGFRLVPGAKDEENPAHVVFRLEKNEWNPA